MIFCNTRATATSLERFLKKNDHSVSVCHSDLSKDERKKVLDEYRQGHTRVLISTDLLGRGIDVQHVSLVINYDVPYKNDNYIHRIGRSGRYGRRGTAINLVTQRDMYRIKEIEKEYRTEINEFQSDYKLEIYEK
jgi:superfamily II DNA/RNA helicase